MDPTRIRTISTEAGSLRSPRVAAEREDGLAHQMGVTPGIGGVHHEDIEIMRRPPLVSVGYLRPDTLTKLNEAIIKYYGLPVARTPVASGPTTTSDSAP